MCRPLIALALLAAPAFPQAPAQPLAWPVDLEAIAKKLEVAELPAVIDLVPADLAKELGELGAMLSQAEIDDALEWSRSSSVAATAALRLLSQSGRSRTKAAGLGREIRACAVFARDPGTSAVEELVRDATGPAWQRALGTPAWERLRGLGARLLREHPDDPAVGLFLTSYGDDFGVSVADRRRIAEQIVQRLGAAAMATDYLRACAGTLVDLDVAAAQRWLAAADAAPRPGCVAGRSWVAWLIFELRGRVAAAERLFAATADSPLDEQILRVRRLQVCDGSAAIEECRRLIAADVPHALPYSVLAAHEATEGNHDMAAQLLASASARPGRDFHTVVAMGLSQFLPLLQRRPESDEQRQEIASDLEAMMRRADEILAGDMSEPVRLFAWLRTEAAFPLGFSVEGLGRGLRAARELQRELPASLPAYLLVLAGARMSSDDAAARDALRAPIPEALSGLDRVARLRAEVSLQRNLVAGGSDMDADLERAFADLEHTQQDACEANYLRGVLQWSRGMRAGDETLMRKARDLFAVAQRPRSEAGWWRAASALCVANTGLGDEDGLGELWEQGPLRDDPRPYIGVSLLTRDLLDANMPPEQAMVAEHVAAKQKGGVLAALLAATAAGRGARGEADGAREAARLALSRLDDLRPHDLGPDSGVACESQFKWNLTASGARASLDINLRCDLWILPKLPDRAKLQALADGK